MTAGAGLGQDGVQMVVSILSPYLGASGYLSLSSQILVNLVHLERSGQGTGSPGGSVYCPQGSWRACERQQSLLATLGPWHI